MKIIGIEVVLGLDKIPSMVPKFYAIVLNRNGNILFSGEVKKNEIPELFRKYRIQALSIDNLWELFRDASEVKSWMRQFQIRIFKSTGPPGKEKKLWQLAKIYGIRTKEGHMGPRDAAYVSAKLVFLGGATEVIFFEDATEIIIGRAKSTGPGGQHANRYARLLASTIQSVFSEICDKLKNAGFDFIAQTKPGDYGLKSARIVVYAGYDEVSKVVQNYRGDLYQIIVRPIEKDKLFFVSKEETTRKPYIIVGIDPGETVGLCILDLDGRILYVGSQSDLGLIKTLEVIYEHGIPIVFSCDVPHTQNLIKRIASKVGAIVYVPKRVLSVEEKRNIVRKLNVKVKDAHERDALVAAFLAWQHYRKLLEKVDYVLSCLPAYFDRDEIKKEVILGKPIKETIAWHLKKYVEEQVMSVLQSIELRLSKVVSNQNWKEERQKLLRHLEEEREKYAIEIKALKEKIRKLKEKIHEKDMEISRLNRLLALKKKELYQVLQEKLSKVESQYISNLEVQLRKALNKIQELEKNIKHLEKENEILRRLLRLSKNEVVIGCVYTLDEVERLYEKYPIEMKAIVVSSTKTPKKEVFELLKKMGVKYILVEQDWKKLKWIEEEIGIKILPFSGKLPTDGDIHILILKDSEFESLLENAYTLAGRDEELLEETLKRIIKKRREELELQIEELE